MSEVTMQSIFEANTDKVDLAVELLGELKDVSVTIDGEPYSGKTLELIGGWDELLLRDTNIPKTTGIGGRAIEFQGKIHFFPSGTTHYVYENGAWTAMPTPPIYVGGCGIVIFEDAIHILGSASASYRTVHYKYDGITWTEVSTLPYEFETGSAVVVYKNEIHILGGRSSIDNTKHYKWNGKEWVEVSVLPYGDSYPCACVFHDEIYYGVSTLFYKWDGVAWTQLTNCPKSLQHGFLVPIYNQIHAYHLNIERAPHSIWNGETWSSNNQKYDSSSYSDKAVYVTYDNDVRRLGGRSYSDKYSLNHYIVLRTYLKEKRGN